MLIHSPCVPESNITIPHAILPWVIHQEAMTPKLKTMAGEAQLTLLSQKWRMSDWWTKYVLGLDRQLVLQREIIMSAHLHPCWYARTIIPGASFQAEPPIFNRLKTESLGDIIFSENRIKRYSMMNYAIDSQCIEYTWLKSVMTDECILWVRLAIFTIDNHYPFFLIEILLPDLYRYCND